MKTLSTIARWLFVVSLPFLLFTATAAWGANSAWLYRYGFEKYDISQRTGLAPSELDKVATGLIRYINSGEEYINLTVEKAGRPFTLFNEREVIHLRDVKGLIWLDYKILLGTLVYTLAYAGLAVYLKKRRELAWGLVWGGGLTLLLMLVLGLGILLDFDALFWAFHLLSFANDFWLLDPTRDYLIMLFPGGLWFDAFLLWALTTLGLAVILAAASGIYLARSRKSTRVG